MMLWIIGSGTRRSPSNKQLEGALTTHSRGLGSRDLITLKTLRQLQNLQELRSNSIRLE
jgi:hypothetical protein